MNHLDFSIMVGLMQKILKLTDMGFLIKTVSGFLILFIYMQATTLMKTVEYG